MRVDGEGVGFAPTLRLKLPPVADFGTHGLIDALIADEEGHIDFLETQLSLFDKLGAERYGLLNAKPASKAD